MSSTDRQKEEETIYSFLKKPVDYEQTLICVKSKFRFKNSLLSLAIAISILLSYLSAYTILTYVHYHYPNKHTNHLFLQVAPKKSKPYNEYLRKLRFLVEAATHPKGSQPKKHNFEIKLTKGTIIYRISNNSYPSTQIWKEDYNLFKKKTTKFGIIYCDTWKNNTNWQPLRYDWIPNLRVAVPLNMLDQTPSSNSGINFLLNDEVSHPTLMAAAGLMALACFVWCMFQCCCQVTTCGGTAIALQRTRKTTKNPDLRSFDPALNHMLAAATQGQPRAGHV